MCFQNFVFLLICCVLAVENGNADVFGSFETDKSKSFGIDEVRCYCNMAECITTGYMCKSSKLGCFSDLAAVTSPFSIEMVTHGCLDLLDKSLQTTCRNLPAKADSSNPPLDIGAPRSLLLCCTEDMCNDVDIPSSRIDLSNQVFNGTETLFADKAAGKMRRTNLTFDTEVFFRLATFTVPVLGAMILFMLVTLAIKLLRSDANEDRMVAMKLRQNDAASLLLNKRHFPNGSGNLTDLEASSKKVPLLYQYDRSHLPPANYLGNRVNLLYPVLPGHYNEKNKANAKLNNVLAPYNTMGSNFEQPLLKINSGNPLANFGPLPMYNSWSGNISNNLGHSICGSDVSANLNSFVPTVLPNVGGCQLNPLNTPQNVTDNLATMVNIDDRIVESLDSCVSVGETLGNVAGTDGATIDVAATAGNVAGTDDATLSVAATSSATSGNGSATNGAAPDVSTQNVAATSGIVAEPVATTSNNLTIADTLSKTNLPPLGHVFPGTCNKSHCSKTSDPRISSNLQIFPQIPPSSLPHHPCTSSSLMGAGSSNVSIPTVFGPFACVTTPATSDEHPIYSLQKSSVSNDEHPMCSLNKSSTSCGCCEHKCFDKTFSNHGCNLCQGFCNERLIASNSTACNNFDSEDNTKLNYKTYHPMTLKYSLMKGSI